MAEADDGYTYAQKVRRVRTVALGDPTLVKLEYISNEDDSKGQKHGFSDNGERKVQNECPECDKKVQLRKGCGEPFRRRCIALSDPTSVPRRE